VVLESIIRQEIVGDAHAIFRRRTDRFIQKTIKKAPLERINAIFDEMRAGRILGRMVLKLA